MHKEKVEFKIVGRWRDKYIHRDGSVSYSEGDFDWGFNQIQNTFATFLAAMAKGDASFSYVGYMAVGSGDSAWDSSPPAKDFNQATLTSEVFRKVIPLVDIVYLDPDTDAVSVTPTNKIEFTVTLTQSEANTTLREFGLFGGTATGASDSGEMVNWIDHARIDKDSSLEIQRKVRIEFLTQ